MIADETTHKSNSEILVTAVRIANERSKSLRIKEFPIVVVDSIKAIKIVTAFVKE